MTHLDQAVPFSHQAYVLEDLMVGQHFIRQARPGLRELVLPHCELVPHPAVPYPFTLVLYMQRAHLAAFGLPDDHIDLSDCTSIQYAYTWNRVIGVVSGPLAAAYRQRALPRDASFSRLAEPSYQTHYFAHEVMVRGVAMQGYWVGRDLHARTGEPLLVIQPMVVDLRTGRRVRSRLTGFVAIPLRDSWLEAVEAAAWENAEAFQPGKAASVVNRFKLALGEWEPVIALVHDTLVGSGARSYGQARDRAPVNELGMRQVMLEPEEGKVVARAG